MKTIWKFQLNFYATLLLPTGATFLHFAQQDEGVHAWFEVDPSSAAEERKFQIVGTGNKVPNNGDFLATALVDGGTLVWHLYEIKERGG